MAVFASTSVVPALSAPSRSPHSGRAPEPPEARAADAAGELPESGEFSEARYLEAEAARHQMRFVPDLDQALDREGGGWKSDGELVCRLPLAWLRRHAVAPVRDAEGRLALAVARPAGWLLAREIGLLLGERPCVPVLTPESAIQNIVNRIFGESSGEEGSVAEVLGAGADGGDDAILSEDAVEDLLEDSGEAPFIRLVNMILAQAVRAGASDIHIEPYRDVSRVRFRLDGVLYERHSLSKAHHAAVVSRIKVMAKLNIAEKRLPQDGRIAISLGGRQAGLRVSTLPTSFGERVVLRLLEKNERVLSLAELGLGREDFQLMNGLVGASHGIVLVTGPTGSGKTTTLYAVLQEIASPDKNILTIEDPVEYELDGVGQMQVNPKIGLSFADGLRSIVRQDPDVILIGEIRDGETASIAVQSALTGHLVFSTLHTNDAPGAVTRLFDMGVEPFLLSSVLRGVIAQRLVRVLCPHCKEARAPSRNELASLGRAARVLEPGQPLYHAVGCPQCMDTGYRGRMAIYEIMPVSDGLKRLIVDKSDANALEAQAIGEGMRNLRHDGMLKVAAGLTSLTEVERVVRI